MKNSQQVQSLLFIGVLAAACGCGANKPASSRGDAGAGDLAIAGGATGTGTTSSLDAGGAGTGGTGGTTGTGGASKTGGATGTGTGGQVSGGTTGSGGGSGGAVKLDAGAPDRAPDATRAEVGGDSKAPDSALDTEHREPDAPADTALDTFRADTANGLSLDSCFVGLPAQVGIQMIATKTSSDGRVRMRIALDTEDRMGTSGTYGWGVIRLGVEVDGVVTCITDRASFDYNGSRHNCDDSATATSGATTYSIVAPDRPTTTLTIQVNGTSTGPTTLTDSTCTMLWSPGTPITCRSGGPC